MALSDPSLPDIAERIVTLHESVLRRLRAALPDAIEIGRLLLEAKDALDHGAFQSWIKEETSISYSSAARYMRLARNEARLRENSENSTVETFTIREAEAMISAPQTREGWLEEAVARLRPVFAEAGATLPSRLPVSVAPQPAGFAAHCHIGRGADPEIYIGNHIEDPADVVAHLAHELVHAVVADGRHDRKFGKLARQVGLAGKLTCTHPGPELEHRIATIVEDLGPYPHKAAEWSKSRPTSGPLPMQRCVCNYCDYVVFVPWRHLGGGTRPFCPVCSSPDGAVPLEVRSARREPKGYGFGDDDN